jgi:gamma-glutamyltranspeptidase/glutathione hydrolase
MDTIARRSSFLPQANPLTSPYLACIASPACSNGGSWGRNALAAGKSRAEAIYAAYDRFYKGDIAKEFVRASREEGGLHTLEDLANWKVHIEEPVVTGYKGIEVYKLTTWVQGPVMLQALNILENAELKTMGFNSAAYIHALYQAMNLAYADRDFYYGDPYFPPEEPVAGLLSKEYARKRFAQIDWERNDPKIKPGDPYPFMGEKNPFLDLIEKWHEKDGKEKDDATEKKNETADAAGAGGMTFEEGFYAGTTSVLAADKEGWVVAMTPSGGCVNRAGS